VQLTRGVIRGSLVTVATVTGFFLLYLSGVLNWMNFVLQGFTISAMGALIGGGIVMIVSDLWRDRGILDVPQDPEIRQLTDRNQYVDSQVKFIESAKGTVDLCLNHLDASAESEVAEKINSALLEARKKGKDIKVLIADGQDRLHGAFELAQEAQIPLKLSTSIHYTDLHFLNVDHDRIVMGIAEISPMKDYVPTDTWAKIRSGSLGEVLTNQFRAIWDDPRTPSFLEYSTRIIKDALKEHPGEFDMLSRLLGLPEPFIRERGQDP